MKLQQFFLAGAVAVVATLRMLETAGFALQSTAQEIRVPATVHADQSIEVFAKVGGYLDSITVDIGDKVTAEQVIATLDIPEMENQLLQKKSMVKQAEAELAQAEAGIAEAEAKVLSLEARVEEALTDVKQKNALSRYAKKEVDRMMNLVGSGAINRELLDSAMFKFESAQAQVGSAEARVATARANLKAQQASITKAIADHAAAESHVEVAEANRDYVVVLMNYSSIQSPFEGEITKRWFDEGAYIQPADGNSAARPIVEIVSISKVRVVANLSMSQIVGVEVGDSATLTSMDALKGQEFEGTISRISAGIDHKTRMLRVEVDLDNPDRRLKPGFFGYLVIKP